MRDSNQSSGRIEIEPHDISLGVYAVIHGANPGMGCNYAFSGHLETIHRVQVGGPVCVVHVIAADYRALRADLHEHGVRLTGNINRSKGPLP